MCRCGLTGRGRTGEGQGRAQAGLLVCPGEPPSRSQECAINWPNPPAQMYFGCCSNCHKYGLTFLPQVFFFSPFPLLHSLSIVTGPSGCGVGEKRPWVVQDEIDKGKKNYGAVQE